MTPLCIVKIGGRPATDTTLTEGMLRDMAADTSRNWILVHGGGADVSALTRKLGMEPTFVDGVRLTKAEEMPLIDAVLAGQVNKRLVRQASSCGLQAVGLCGADGSLFTGEALSEESHTGRVVKSNGSLARLLLNEGYFPVVSSVSADESGKALNINADEAALALAVELKAQALIFLSDIPGIMKEGAVMHSLTEEQVEQEIADRVIEGGMVVKARTSLSGLKDGINTVIIGQYEESGDLKALLGAEKGTSLKGK